MPTLTNYGVIFDILLSPTINIKPRMKLLQVAHEAIKFTLTNELSKSRQKLKKGIIVQIKVS